MMLIEKDFFEADVCLIFNKKKNIRMHYIMTEEVFFMLSYLCLDKKRNVSNSDVNQIKLNVLLDNIQPAENMFPKGL
jgi:hypothetical protein